MTTETLRPQYLTIAGKRVVVLEEADFERLAEQADVWEPTMPVPNADGNYPAFETMAVVQALDVLRTRRRLGLSQIELARLAGIRLSTLKAIEHADLKPNVRAFDKIDAAFKVAEAGHRKVRNGKSTKGL